MINQLFIKTIFILTILFFSIFPQNKIIKSFVVKGNNYFSKNDYLEWSKIKINQAWFNGITDTIARRILKSLSDNGFHFAKINSIDENNLDSLNVEISLNIDEDYPTKISNINFINQDSSDIKLVEEKFKFLKGEILSKASFEEVINDVLNHYENNGFPFTKITVQSIFFDSIDSERTAKITLIVDKGVLCKIDKVEIKGNESTKDYVIIRELRLPKGLFYSQEKIYQLPEKLNKLRFFEPVKTPTFYINNNDEGVLLIEVKERQTNNFDGIIGYIPPGKNEDKGYITGLVNISLRNLFGTGRAIALRWNKFSRKSQELELKYLEPWLFSYPFNIVLNLYQRIQDTTYVQRKFEGQTEYLSTETISASVILGTESIIPTERVVPVFTVFNSSLITTGVSFKLDTRDDPFSPTKGILLENKLLYSRKKINGPLEFVTNIVERNISLQRIISDFRFFFSIFNKQVSAFSFHLRELKGKSFENSDLFKFGGTNSLRGYIEEQFLANRVFWTNIEYRFLLTKRSFVFPFFDFGYYMRQFEPLKRISKSEAFLYGYGVGLNIETGLGILAISFALGKDDSFSEGKIHFGVVNEF
jgi:outer membrane protein insertion porin family